MQVERSGGAGWWETRRLAGSDSGARHRFVGLGPVGHPSRCANPTTSGGRYEANASDIPSRPARASLLLTTAGRTRRRTCQESHSTLPENPPTMVDVGEKLAAVMGGICPESVPGFTIAVEYSYLPV